MPSTKIAANQMPIYGELRRKELANVADYRRWDSKESRPFSPSRHRPDPCHFRSDPRHSHFPLFSFVVDRHRLSTSLAPIPGNATGDSTELLIASGSNSACRKKGEVFLNDLYQPRIHEATDPGVTSRVATGQGYPYGYLYGRLFVTHSTPPSTPQQHPSAAT